MFYACRGDRLLIMLSVDMASYSTYLRPKRNDALVRDKPVCAACGSYIWVGGMTRLDINTVVRAIARQVQRDTSEL